MGAKRNQIQLLAKAARASGYSVKKIGTKDTTMLGDAISVSNGEMFWIASAKRIGYYPNTPAWFKQLCNSKETSSKILKQLGYKVVTGVYFPAPKLNDEVFIKKLCVSIKKYPVVCKPEQGVKGSGIKIAYNLKQLQQYIKTATTTNTSFSAQPLIGGNEFRITVIENKIFIMHGKTNRVITGNGKDSIATLCKNSRSAPDKNYLTHIMEENGMTIRTVLPADISLPIKVAKKDAPPIYFENEIPDAAKKWALGLCGALGCTTIGIDVVVPEDMTKTANYKIFEINASPAFAYLEPTYSCEHLVDKIAKHIVDTSFNKK